ncbi:MAG: hypothetical protein IKQ06_06030 [Bacilli bacterium]|nr:hypothetical protein [Bacilli bacterium]MBR6137695.1 hypothetical protein [Bacilli bacterium]
MKKKQLVEEYNDCWIYVLLLTTLTILIQSVKSYKFMFMGCELGYNIFLIPGIYFLSNYICKKYDYKKAIAAIAISGVIFVGFIVTMEFALGKGLVLSTLVGDFCGYVVSQFVNLMIYVFLLNNTRSPYILVLLNYIFSIIVYYMIYTLMYLNLVIQDGYWLKYFITIGIDAVICLVVALIDKRIKRGI